MCRYFKVNLDFLRGEGLEEFAATHKSWIEKVSAAYLDRKKQRLDKFLHYLPCEAFPIDLLGILIYARICHEHVAVFVGEHYWTTHVDNDFKKCRVFLAYRGELVFDDSRMMTSIEYAAVRKDVNKYRNSIAKHNEKLEQKEKELDKKERERERAKELKKQQEQEHPKKRKVTNQIESDSENDLEKLLEETDNDNVQKEQDADIMQNQDEEGASASNTQTENNIMQKESETDIMQNQATNEDELMEGDVEENIMQKPDKKDKEYFRKIKEEQKNRKNSLQSSKKKNKTITVPPSTHVLRSRNVKDKGSPVKYSDVVMDSVEKAKSGSLDISNFRLHRRKRRERKFVCSSCKKDFSSSSELGKHIKKDHPGFKYTCKKCNKSFDTKNGLYKHVLLHGGKRFECNTCGKLFYWKCELADHMWRHTKKPAQRISCPVRGCKKTYLSKRALQRHTRDDHNPGGLIVCDFILEEGQVCGKELKSKTLYNQHYTHAHTEGFQALCGKFFPWPKDRNDHQKNDCDLCAKIAAKKNKLNKKAISKF